FLLHPGITIAQYRHKQLNDTTYYSVYPNMVTTRFYFSQKYTAFTLKAPGEKAGLHYRPNTTLNMGVGATYHNFSLNLAYGFGFLNPDTGKGKTKYLDLQGHFYPGKWALDWFGQFYKGYYLKPKGYAAITPDAYYLRPDVKVNIAGLAAYRLLNNNRFSYNAAIIQNEWQKKPAGSLLLGAEMHYGVVKADSAFVPKNLGNEYTQADINNIKYFSFGPGAGYAYTLVLRQHFFAMGSLALNFNLAFTTENGLAGKSNKFAINPSSIFRMAAGYNSDTWNISANWVGNNLPLSGASSSNNYLLQTGNYRIIFSKKIMPGPKLKRPLAFANKIIP
ncbi:MAG TPA: DUF4421 domain-containing protein, partial [Panacibacter sp.]|nr:DUF4421 domain-containing protein [Panacibacter sp.]